MFLRACSLQNEDGDCLFFCTFQKSVTHHLSMVKFSEKKSMLQTFARTSLKGCTKRKAFAEKETIGPSQDPVTWYGKKFYWDANNAVRLPKQRNSYHSSLTFLRFRSPTASVASQCNSFLTDVTGSCKGPIHLFQSWVW